ncbi:MAG: hypothetical protein HYU64_02260 [Armatimonadetes bacterium]|nr:hypothetical protein [Armatimonadota bacterium]
MAQEGLPVPEGASDLLRSYFERRSVISSEIARNLGLPLDSQTRSVPDAGPAASSDQRAKSGEIVGKIVAESLSKGDSAPLKRLISFTSRVNREFSKLDVPTAAQSFHEESLQLTKGFLPPLKDLETLLDLCQMKMRSEVDAGLMGQAQRMLDRYGTLEGFQQSLEAALEALNEQSLKLKLEEERLRGQ